MQRLSGRVLDSRPRDRGSEPHWHHWDVTLSKKIYPSLVLVQPRKTCPIITERLLMGLNESNQTKHYSGTSGSLFEEYKNVAFNGEQEKEI